jgi:uncharacterized membrane protein YbhN (UPF0104 family)
MDETPAGIQTQAPLPGWQIEYGPKRDNEPHRAELLTLLANASTAAAWIFTSAFPFLLIVPANVLNHKSTRRDPVGLAYCALCLTPALIAFGSTLWTRRLVSRDLKRMQAGDMDERGLAETEEALHLSRKALWVCVLGPILWIAALSVCYAIVCFLASLRF